MVKNCPGASAIVTVLTFLQLCGCQGQPGFMAAPPNSSATVELAGEEDVVPASYIVMFRSPNSRASLYFATFFDEYQHHYLRLADEVLADPRIKSLDVLDSQDLSPRNEEAGWRADFDPPASMQLFWQEKPQDIASGVMTRVDFASQESASEVLKEWELQGRIWYAEPNGISRPKQAPTPAAAESMWKTFNTSYTGISAQWHQNIHLMEAFSSLAASTTKPTDDEVLQNPPLIAVLDSGVDYLHPLLKEAIWDNSENAGESGCDNDVHGCNTTAPSKGSLGNGDVWPVGASGPNQRVEGEGSHGTHVAGIIAAKPDKGRGIGGVCPVCKIMVVKVAEIEGGSQGAKPGISDDSQIRGLKYVTRFKSANSNAVRIVNSSFGKYSRSRSVAILVDSLKKIGNGTLVVAAASNEDSMIRSYPGALANAVAVAALTNENRKARFSNFGPWVDVAAPGVQIPSTTPGDTTKPQDGTSMASPVTAGAAGLYLTLNPNASFNELRNRILDCADATLYTADTDAARFNSQHYFADVGEEARRPLLGSGILNVDNMITGNCKNSVGKPLDRVTPGCSSIGLGVESAASRGMLLLSALLPALVMAFGGRR